MNMHMASGRTFVAPLTFKSPVHGGVLGAAHRGLALTYRYEPVQLPQARWRGRDLILPEIDLGRYETRAVIDYVCFRVLTCRTMWGNTLNAIIKSLGGSSRVQGPDWKDSHFGDDFIVTVNDPDPVELLRLLRALRAHPSIRAAGELRLLEVSVDWYAESGDAADRLRMTEVLRRHLKPEPWIWRMTGSSRDREAKDSAGAPRHDGSPRFVVRPGEGGSRLIFGGGFGDPAERVAFYSNGSKVRIDPLYARVLNIEAHAQPSVDGTTYVGPDDRQRVMLRVMDKVEDRRDPKTGVGVPLPPEERRSRLEVRIGVDHLHELGLKSCDDLFGFDFQAGVRRRFFSFYLATSPALPASRSHRYALAEWRRRQDRVVFRRSGVLGVHLHQQAMVAVANGRGRPRVRNGTGKDGYCKVYTELVERTDDALHALTRSWGSPVRTA